MPRWRPHCCSNGRARSTGARRRSARRGRLARSNGRPLSPRRCSATTALRGRQQMGDEMTAIGMGVHVVDVLARPIEAIPEGQGGQLVDEIRITPAGSAGGTAITLAKLGAQVRTAGAIGSDALGDVLIELLQR